MEGEKSLDLHFMSKSETLEVPAHQIKPFIVLQWNVLAGGLGDAKAFPRVPPADLDQKTRGKRIVDYLSHSELDIIVMEEIDFPDIISSALPGFDWKFQAKSSDNKSNPDGVMIGVRRSLDWSISDTRHHRYTDISGDAGSRLALEVELRHKTEDRHLFVFGTHLKAKKTNSDIRLHEISQLLPRLMQIMDQGHPLILAGDFNAEPHESSVRAVIDSGMKKTVKSDIVHTTGKYHSEHDHAVRQIDYIFYGPRLLPVHSWQQSTHALSDALLPDSRMPSDHLPIYCKFVIDDK